MPEFTFSAPDGKSYTVSGPEGATPEQAFGILQKQIAAPAGPQGVMANAVDLVKSAPRALLSGISNTLSATGQAEQLQMNQPVDVPSAPEMTGGLEKNITGELHKPQTPAGKIGTAAIESLASPLSFLGPGSLPLKVGGALLSGGASEAAGQAAEGTKYETPARIAGALAGGVGAGKLLAPAAERAAVPTMAELRASAERGYDNATASGLELHPQGVAQTASRIEQDLVNNHAHTGGQYGTAPKTLDVLETLQNPPAGATITAANLSTVRKNLGRIAGETNEGRPTPDAHAASVALEHLRNYTENIPAAHAMAGDPAAYVAAIRQANGDYAAAMRSRTIDTKLTRAENNAAGGIHTSPDNQIKSQLRQILNNPKQQRGFSQEELAAMDRINRGTVASNSLRQVGRAGAGVVPMMAHALTAVGTGGASIPASLGIGIPLYAARKIAERLTRGQANRLDEMIRRRSPEFEARASRVPAVDRKPNIAAIARALATGVH